MVRKKVKKRLSDEDKEFILANIQDSPYALARDLNIDIKVVKKFLNTIAKKDADYDVELANVEECIERGDTSIEIMERRNAILIKIATKEQKENIFKRLNFQGERNLIF